MLLHSWPPPYRGNATTDLDAFLTANRSVWERLDALLRRARSDPRRLTGAELDELVRLHLRTSSHLSTVRTVYGEHPVATELSQLVARSSALVHGSPPRSWYTLWRGLTETFPAAVWHVRRAILTATLVFVLTGLVVGVWLAVSPAAFEAAMPAEVREAYLERDFEAYYSSEPGTTFAARVFTNNAAVGALAFATGVGFGVPTILILVLNGVNVGIAAGLFHAAGDAARFWGLILPHGLLELTAVFVAGGAGLQLGWALIAPGDRLRREALAAEARRAVVIVLGLVVVFAIAGVVEAFVTPAPWPATARVGAGALVWLAVSVPVALAGRQAAARGLTGALGEQPRSADTVLPAGASAGASPARSTGARP